MHEILHIIGICADASAHPDLIDFIMVNYHNIHSTINYILNKL